MVLKISYKICFSFSNSTNYECEVNLSPGEFRLALNDVFIAEAHAARTTYYELQIDDQPIRKQKSSGIIVSTGTGSTAWYVPKKFSL